jgi:NTP pyrophosphatase (non-canonical NTP hydrolase)
MDQQTTLETLKEAVAEFISARNWQSYHDPKNLSLSIAIESAELMEHFQWLTDDQAAAQVLDHIAKMEIADELADVVIYCLSFANQADIDVSEAVMAKLSRNELRFPKPSMKSSADHQV